MKARNPLTKFKLGLLVFGVFSLVLVILVLVQASATKADTKTYKAADKISSTLNNYILEHQTIPASLSAAGATDVPSTISYTKLSSTQYKFCATYKATSSDFDSSDVQYDLFNAATGGGTSYNDDYLTSSDQTSLYIDTTHKKGENCQTVKPDIYNYGGGCVRPLSSNTTNLYSCYDDNSSSINNQTISN